VSGDTRFDRVATILEKDNTLDFIAQFKDNTVQLLWEVRGQKMKISL
jgi:3-deoxy-D-manno-octulosonic-acid transferase